MIFTDNFLRLSAPSAAASPSFLWRPSTLSGGISLIDARIGSERYLCLAISEKPSAAAVQTDTATVSAGGKQVKIYHGSESTLPVLFVPDRKHETKEQGQDKEGELKRRIENIKEMLRSMDDGDISISAYDTAWVALVPKIDGAGGPQFPTSLKWIEENQLPDGSWGDPDFFIAHDRLINTLACVIALKSWGVSPDRCQRGVSFLSSHMKRLDEDLEHMPIGFEVAFPALVEMATAMDLGIPTDSPGLEEINARKTLKLKRIPKDMLHKVPTTLLHSLEGMRDLDWEKILALQSPDGSFLFSPSSTAFALMCTGDRKCLDYLQKIVQRFDGGVPNVYPVDLFERLWAVDRLQRLGISRYFIREIRQCLDYVYSLWTEEGISWARFSTIQDVDDTAMGFRLLRLHGYDVSADVFRRFEKDGEFFCLPGQSTQAVTGMYNLNRASQLSFPGEDILSSARRFSDTCLRERRALGDLKDKWIITKDLPGEVGYALDFPWHASLPRVEARIYLEQYGGERDVWIGKTLYRMPCVNNDDFLELAKLDFQLCQSFQKLELLGLQRWFEETGLRSLRVSKKNLQSAYFLAAASIFEPERSSERLGWARTVLLMDAVSAHLTSPNDDCTANSFLNELRRSLKESPMSSPRSGGELNSRLRGLLEDLALYTGQSSAATHAQIRQYLFKAWEDWLLARARVEDESGLLLVRSLELCAGRTDLEESLRAAAGQPFQVQQIHANLARLISSLSRRLRPLRGSSRVEDPDQDMQELVQVVLRNSAGEGECTLQTFLTVAKSFFYYANCDASVFQLHVDRVLFEDVV
ncbi:ent-copalyl diphosphate synthase 1-like isoform X2 [Wolffia australiana]